ncbi:MAG: hypothetical protein QOF06_1239 [Solirubrobacterales bacterium]|nr:hypothetical protein [Solirubrobacterales bacterium]
MLLRMPSNAATLAFIFLRCRPDLAGQWLVEQPPDIHEAANRGSSPVVIYLATLLKSGAPPATPVTLR